MTEFKSPLPRNDTNDRLISWLLEIAQVQILPQIPELEKRVESIEADLQIIEAIFQSQEEKGILVRIESR